MTSPSLPSLGVGVIYSSGLEDLLEAGRELIDLVEIEPQAFWFRDRSGDTAYRAHPDAVARIQAIPLPKLVHGVGFPVGGTARADADQLRPFVDIIISLGSPWASEHLSFNRVAGGQGEFNTGFLLPPIQSPESVATAATNIRELRQLLPVPFAFETGVNYLHPRRGELSDGSFFGAVAEAADSGILLDVHNLWTNERNGRQRVLDAMAEMPLARVWEMHLAGGQEHEGYWMDAHSGLVPDEVMELAAEIIPMLPNLHAINFEILPEYIQANAIALDDLLEQLAAIRGLWSRRLSPVRVVSTGAVGSLPSAAPGLPPPAAWEWALGSLTVGSEPRDRLGRALAEDPAVEVLRDLVRSGRASAVVDLLRLSCRLILLTLGEPGLRGLLEAFWAVTRPQAFGSEEAAAFGAFVKSRDLAIPHLEEVVDFELAVQATAVDGSARTVRFTVDPTPLLSALGEGRIPESGTPGAFEVNVEP